MAGRCEGRQLSGAEVKEWEVKAQDREGMQVENEEGQGPLWAVVLLMTMDGS
jgi:hypothetical protein